ncbi:response regulator [Patescibacteria group bacterium]|nr:response regulator [Patescibacteria group bacterium]MBU2219866.1 response regulator [Patescibacteria group bacterium]
MEKPKILVVEDDSQWHRIYQRELGDLFEVIIAQTVEDGERLYAENPDVVLIIMDACVPGDEPTTLELTEKIRQTFIGPMIGASSMPDYRLALLKAGCDYSSDKGTAARKMAKELTGV